MLSKPNIITRKSNAKFTGIGIMQKQQIIPQDESFMKRDRLEPTGAFKSTLENPLYNNERSIYGTHPNPKYENNSMMVTPGAKVQQSKPMMLVNKLPNSRPRF